MEFLLQVPATENAPLKIVGVDTQNDAVMAVKSGRIDALISQDGHESDAFKKNNFIKNELITADNAEHFLLQEDF